MISLVISSDSDESDNENQRRRNRLEGHAETVDNGRSSSPDTSESSESNEINGLDQQGDGNRTCFRMF